MAAGYTAGWGEIMLGGMMATAEILCKARGDATCLFLRTVPHKLNDAVTRFCKKHDIKNHGGLPIFLRNRKKTLLNLNVENENDNDKEERWLDKNWKKIFKKKDTKHQFNSKVFNNSEYLNTDVIEQTTKALDKFFIDPRHGVVELADDKCVLLRGDGLSREFFTMVEELFMTQGKSSAGYKSFSSKFLFDLGKSIGKSNQDWFVDRISLVSPIQKAQALCINLKYFGWSNMKFTDGLSIKEIMKKKENFVVQCECTTSFEAESWIKKKEQCLYPMCYIHCGFITGWFERCFEMNVVCVEKECKAAGDKKCVFVIGLVPKISKLISTEIYDAFEFVLSDKSQPSNLMDQFRNLRKGDLKNGSPIQRMKRLRSISTKKQDKTKVIRRSSSLELIFK